MACEGEDHLVHIISSTSGTDEQLLDRLLALKQWIQPPAASDFLELQEEEDEDEEPQLDSAESLLSSTGKVTILSHTTHLPHSNGAVHKSNGAANGSKTTHPLGDPQPFSLLHHNNLPHFMWYVLDQRFGWKEGGDARTNKDGTLNKDVSVKPQLIGILDDYIKWFQGQDISVEMLDAYIFCIDQACQKPLVRKQVLNLCTDWLKALDLEAVEDEIYPLLRSVLISGLQDVWSAVRSIVASRLSLIIDAFTLQQLGKFFNELVQTCRSEESSWQAKEGAILAMNSAVRRFQWISVDPGDLQRVMEDQKGSSESKSPRTQYFLKFGQDELPGLPRFITSQMKSTVFSLLAHPQVTVRENATKAFSSYLARCDFKEALSAFKDIVTRLCRGTKYASSSFNNNDELPHLSILDPGFNFMDAYEAEGLLGVCVCLVKHIPPGFLLPNWPVYFSAFCLYLMHPASAVRQVASDIFKFLVAKDSHNPMILKLVLEGLTRDWSVSVNALSMPCNRAVNPALQQSSSATGWNALPKGATVRQSITHIANTHSKKSQLQEAWEWREGRLFAYEVILQFVIKNHIIYTFGSLNTAVNQITDGSPALTPNSSAEENMFPRKRRLSVSSQESSEGGFSLKSSPLCRTFSDKHRSGGSSNPSTPVIDFTPIANANGMSASMTTDDSDTYTPEEDMQNRVRRVNRFTRPRNSIATYTASHEYRRPSYYNQPMTVDSKLMSKMPTVAGFNAPSLRTLVKHYSYYTQNSVPFSPPSMAPVTGKTASLLQHTLALDMQQAKSSKPPNSPRYDNTLNPDKEKLRSCLCPSPIGDTEEPEWLESIEICSLANILKLILYQTIQSIADTQWELRRMGQQLLPCVVEVIRWYDMRILEELWLEHLRPTTSLMCYGACVALKHSMDHVARLMPMLQNTPHTWQDTEVCRQVASRITQPLQACLPRLSTIMHGLLLRPCYDRITIVAMEIIMMAHTHFQLPAAQQSVQVGSMVSVMKEIFAAAHPESPVVTHFRQKQKPRTEFLTPVQGFLSCILLQADGVKDAARQVEKTMCSSLHMQLSAFLLHSELQDISPLLPILAVYIGHYADMDTFHKALVDSLSSVVNACVNVDKPPAGLKLPSVMTYLVLCLKELTNVIMHKTLELTMLRQVLDIYINLCTLVPAEQHLGHTLHAVYARLNITTDGKSNMALYQRGTGGNTDLANTPDIGSLPQQDSQGSETDEDEIDLPSQGMAESQMLNISSLGTRVSGRLNSTSVDGRPSSSMSDQEDEESDWDSWDEEEEEEDHAILRQMFVEFLVKLQGQYKANGKTSYKDCLNKLPMRERKVIDGLR